MKCKSCGADIIFAPTESGKKMPLDQTPKKAAVMIRGLAKIMDVYTPHWATCTSPERHRKGA